MSNEALKITVDDKGNVKVFENGEETPHVRRVVFTAGVDEVPQLAIERFFIDAEPKK